MISFFVATSDAILIKWVDTFEIKPVLIFLSAPVTFKYLKIIYFELYLFVDSLIKFSNSNFDAAYWLKGFKGSSSATLSFLGLP